MLPKRFEHPTAQSKIGLAFFAQNFALEMMTVSGIEVLREFGLVRGGAQKNKLVAF